MNRQTSQYAKVGFAIFFFVAVLAYALLWLRGLLSQDIHITVLFDDARGIQSGEIAEMAGVTIGQVADVTLTKDHRAKVTALIHKSVPIPVGSQFGIKSALLGGQAQLVITPSDRPEVIKDQAVVEGVSSDPLNETLAQAPKTIAKVQDLVAESQRMVVRLENTFDTLNSPARQAKLDAILNNMQRTTAGLPGLESRTQNELVAVSRQTQLLLASLQSTEAKADKVMGSAGKLANSLNSTVDENRATLRSILRSADDTSSALAGITDQLKSTIGDPKIKANLVSATDKLASISDRMDAAAGDIERLTSDPRLASDIRETVSNLRETSASVRDLSARIQGIHIPGERRKPDGTPSSSEPGTAKTPPLPTAFLLEPGLVLDSVYDTKVERMRFDADYTLLAGKPGQFYRAGLFDATYGNRLNLQMGQTLGSDAAYRYGLFAGKIGTGLDLRTGPLFLSLDLYDPNRATVNARARAYINRTTAISAGIDSLGNGNRATVGIQIQK